MECMGSPPRKRYCLVMAALLATAAVCCICTPVLADNPSEVAMALSKKADDLVAQERFMEAVDLYNEAIALDPYSSTIWNRLGVAEMSVGRYPDAVTAFQRALELDPYYTKAWTNKGDALQAQGKYQDAIDSYDRTLAIYSSDLHALLQKGICLQQMGRSNDAMEAYTEVVRLAEREVRKNPNEARYDATLWANKGEALARLGRYDEALQAYQNAVQINPKYERALSGIEYVNETLYRAKVSPESVKTPLATVTGSNGELPVPLQPFSAVMALGIAALAILILGPGQRRRRG